MAERVPLRDQCDHGRYDWHDIKTGRLYGTDITESCPGGREVTIDYEAAATAYAKGPSWVTTAGMDEAEEI